MHFLEWFYFLHKVRAILDLKIFFRKTKCLKNHVLNKEFVLQKQCYFRFYKKLNNYLQEQNDNQLQMGHIFEQGFHFLEK